MEFRVMDVGHGSCAYLKFDDRNAWLFDCGWRWETGLADRLKDSGIDTITRLYMTNEDEDHLRGFTDLKRSMPPRVVFRNPTISIEEWLSRKAEPHTNSIREWHQWVRNARECCAPDPERMAIVTVTYNRWRDVNYETNNASLVCVLEVRSPCYVKIVMTGDMEGTGWRKLKEKNRSLLGKMITESDCYIAAHHGRENGYDEEVVRCANPKLVVMSDHKVKYETQRGMATRYGQYARGTEIIRIQERNTTSLFGLASSERLQRKVVTTRKDGDIWWRPEKDQWFCEKHKI